MLRGRFLSTCKWQPTPVFLPGESQGWGSLVGCHLWGFEIGHDQGAEVSTLMMDAGFKQVRVIKDYAGLDRVVSGIY